MGIDTAYRKVGNFGSRDRMYYTIIGQIRRFEPVCLASAPFHR